MAKQKKTAQPLKLNAIERLSLRFSEVINSSKAQDLCSALIHRLNIDMDAEWDVVIEQISDTSGVSMVFQDNGGVLLEWGAPTDDDRVLEMGEIEVVAQQAPFKNDGQDLHS